MLCSITNSSAWSGESTVHKNTTEHELFSVSLNNPLHPNADLYSLFSFQYILPSKTIKASQYGDPFLNTPMIGGNYSYCTYSVQL